MRIDLHCHSNHSDGAHPPAAVVRTAVAEGVDVLALSDHDSLTGIAEARREAQGLGIRLLGGVELTTHRAGEDIHVLGLFLEPGNDGLEGYLEARRSERRDRVHRIAERLAKVGVRFDPDEVLRNAAGESIGRPHIARALVEAKVVGSIDEAFDRYLANDKPGYVPNRAPDPSDGIRAILGAGGVPVLAHPVLYKGKDLIPSLAEAGLVGLEVYHPDQAGREAEFRRKAREHRLIQSGGSDYHGHSERRYFAPGRFTCPVESFNEMEARARPIAASPSARAAGGGA
ncbi:MAG: PHP domain-containing protein [Planctomycetes bacterium]|nr:PHP domain-containing protein [Planctomycetota bacterium]